MFIRGSGALSFRMQALRFVGASGTPRFSIAVDVGIDWRVYFSAMRCIPPFTFLFFETWLSRVWHVEAIW